MLTHPVNLQSTELFSFSCASCRGFKPYPSGKYCGSKIPSLGKEFLVQHCDHGIASSIQWFCIESACDTWHLITQTQICMFEPCYRVHENNSDLFTLGVIDWRSFFASLKDKWVALREKVLNILSRRHTKRRTGTRGFACPSFGRRPTFLEFFWKKKKFWFFFFFLKSRCHTKRRAGAAPGGPNKWSYNLKKGGLSGRAYLYTFSMGVPPPRGVAPRAHPSFGMALIQGIRDLFAWCSPNINASFPDM